MDELAAHVPKMLSLSVAAAVATFPRQSSRTARRADPAERRVNVRADLVPFQSLRGNKVKGGLHLGTPDRHLPSPPQDVGPGQRENYHSLRAVSSKGT